jgi:hypothetical protein
MSIREVERRQRQREEAIPPSVQRAVSAVPQTPMFLLKVFVALLIGTALITAPLAAPALTSIISGIPSNEFTLATLVVAAPAAIPTFLRFKHLKERGIVDNYVTLDRWIKEYGFPPGRLLGPNIRAWTDQEIAEWFASRPTEAPEAIQQRRAKAANKAAATRAANKAAAACKKHEHTGGEA